MRLVKAHIFGYGKFVGFEMEFLEGFQVVYGPNESGKTTLFNFLLDMIFGQKISKISVKKGAQNSDNYYAYKPWDTNEYKGELVIISDNIESRGIEDKKIIHLRRTFYEKGSTLVVNEGVNPRDITNRYPVLSNGEVAFAQTQFGINRDLFVSVATISMKTLDQLGSSDCIKKIKEHLIRLIDTGSLESSLREIIEGIGNGSSGYLRKLLIEKQRLEDRKSELISLKDEQLNLRREYIDYKKRFSRVSKELSLLQKEVEELKGRVAYSKKYRLWRRKNDAKALKEQLDKLTSQYFIYSGVKDFPLNMHTRLVQLKTTYDHLVAKKQELQKRLNTLTSEIDVLELELRSKKYRRVDNINQVREKFNRLNDNILKIESQLQEKRRLCSRLEQELKDLEERKKSFPGIDKIGQEFIDIFDGMINLYNTLVTQIKEKEKEREKIEEELVQLDYELHPLRKVFGDYLDINTLVKEYNDLLTLPKEKINKLQREIDGIRSLISNYNEEKSTHFIVGVICFVLSLMLGYFYFLTYNLASVLFASITFIAWLYCLTTYMGINKELFENQRLIEAKEEELRLLNSESIIEQHPIRLMMSSANVIDTSELLGIHNEYLLLLSKKRELEDRLCNIENDISEYQDSKDSVFLKMIQELSAFGLELKDENDIPKMRQELIRLKDKAKDFINKAHDLTNQISDLKNEIKVEERNLNGLKTTVQQEVYDKVMPVFVEMGLVEPDGDISSDTFMNYFNLQREVEDLRKKVTEKRKDRENLYNELKQLEDSITSTFSEIEEIFELGGVKDFEEWNSKYEQAKKAHEIYEKIERTKIELDCTLDDYTLEKIDEILGDFVPVGEPDNLDEIEKVFYEAQGKFEWLKKQHEDLKIKITELSSKMKEICEIEEEIQNINLRLSIIEDEEEAVGYAITTLTRLSQDKDSEILSKLENEISSLFSKITHQRYTKVKLEKDFSPLVYCPERGEFLPLEELNLSQGTVDQLYFSIRIAILRTMSAKGEKLPMILDEPFLNYDTERLAKAIQTLKGLGDEHQIILFTCKEEVRSCAEIMNVPVISIKVN